MKVVFGLVLVACQCSPAPIAVPASGGVPAVRITVPSDVDPPADVVVPSRTVRFGCDEIVLQPGDWARGTACDDGRDE